MASDIFLYRKDRRWQKFSKIDEIILTGSQFVYSSVTGVNSTDVLTIANNSLSNGDSVYFTSLTGGSALSINTMYYVVNKSGNTFQIAASVGGSALNLGSDITAGNLLQTQPDMNVWSGEYRDVFNYSTDMLDWSSGLSGGVLTSSGVSVLPEGLSLATVTGFGILATVPVAVTATGLKTAISDDVNHTPLRQSVLKKTHWRFRQANNATPTYLYATWAEGDQISNSPPETE